MKLNQVSFCSTVFFFKFYIWLSRLSSKRVENSSIPVLEWRAEENLVVNNKNNRVFMSWNYRSDSCPVANLIFFKLEHLFWEHQISAGQLSADSSARETLYCFNSSRHMCNTDHCHHTVKFRKWLNTSGKKSLYGCIFHGV